MKRRYANNNNRIIYEGIKNGKGKGYLGVGGEIVERVGRGSNKGGTKFCVRE